MKLFRFDVQVGRTIDQFNSVNVVLSKIIRLRSEAQVVCMHLAAGGVVGYHQATVEQLFLVVQGAGWVRGETSEPVSIVAGEAAFWTGGEWHESGTDAGMTAIVIESASLNPAALMPAKEG